MNDNAGILCYWESRDGEWVIWGIVPIRTDDDVVYRPVMPITNIVNGRSACTEHWQGRFRSVTAWTWDQGAWFVGQTEYPKGNTILKQTAAIAKKYFTDLREAQLISREA